MIDAKSVRLGNWIYATDGTKKQVTLEALKYLQDYAGINQATGIHINPERLECAGFEKEYDIDGVQKTRVLKYRRKAIHVKFRDGRLESVVLGGGTRLKHIEYMHQLQNLFFAWYGTEMEINFSPVVIQK